MRKDAAERTAGASLSRLVARRDNYFVKHFTFDAFASKIWQK